MGNRGGSSYPLCWPLLFPRVSICSSNDHELQTGTGQPVPQSFQIFWSRFLSGSEQLSHLQQRQLLWGGRRPGCDINPSPDARAFILDHYTGVGEVLAIHQLDRVPDPLNHPIRVKRGAFSLDDAKNNDLIFVGSPSENLTLLDLPGTKEFVFRRLDSDRARAILQSSISILCPVSRQFMRRHSANQPTTEDYAP